MGGLIITAGYGYGSEQLKPFLASAGRHVPTAEVVVFADDDSDDFARRLAAFNSRVRVVVPADHRIRRFLGRSRRRLRMTRDVVRPLLSHVRLASLGNFGTALLDVTVARFFWTRALLRGYGSDRAILLSDSRDVYFQGDPFEGDSGGLICGEEPILIGKCPFNTSWIELVYSRAWAERLAAMPVLCSGVTLGSYPFIRSYVDHMVAEIEEHRGRLLRRFAPDQAAHNKLLHGDRILPFSTSRNGDALLATLHYSDLSEFRFDQGRGLETRAGEPVRIVHQYDRHQELTDWVGARYGTPPKPPTPRGAPMSQTEPRRRSSDE